MINEPLVSVIMPAYNSQRTIAQSVRSVLSQTYHNVELIVINDGSTDYTAEELYKISDHRLVILHQENRGVSAARNSGLKICNGSYISFLDSDDLWAPNKLELQLRDMQSEGSHFSYGMSYKFRTGESRCDGFTSWPLINTFGVFPIFVLDYITWSSVVISRDAFNHVGYFDPSFRGTEDWDYLIRLQSHYNPTYISNAVTFYRLSAHSLSSSPSHCYEELAVIAKHGGNESTSRRVAALLLWGGKGRQFIFSVVSIVSLIRTSGFDMRILLGIGCVGWVIVCQLFRKLFGKFLIRQEVPL